MAADTNSPLLGLLLQGTGNNSNTWGANLNDFVISYLEQAVAGYQSKSLAGGAATLSEAQHRAATLEFTGTLSSNATVTVNNTAKRWRIFNNTSGNFVVLLKTSSGAAIEIPQGTHKDVVCNGSNVLYRLDQDTVGTLVHHAGSTAPAGTIQCAGGTFVRADHPNLFTAIGTTHGAGNGVTTAGLPDYVTNNRFLRASGGSLSVGTNQTSQNKAHIHAGTSFSGSGTTGGQSAGHTHGFSWSGTTDGMNANNPHSHGVSGATIGGSELAGLQNGSYFNGPVAINASAIAITSTNINHGHTYSGSGTTNGNSGDHTHAVTVTGTTGTIPSDGGTEARPENAAVMICIKL